MNNIFSQFSGNLMRFVNCLFRGVVSSGRAWVLFLTCIPGPAWLPLAYSQVSIPNIQQAAPGTLIKGPIDPEMGRLTVIQYLGGYIITIPEPPGSESKDHHLTKAWDISDLSNPIAVEPKNPNRHGGHFGETGDPILAHGSFSRANEVYIDGNGKNSNDGKAAWNVFDAVRLNNDGRLEHVRWAGNDTPTLRHPNGKKIKEPSGEPAYARWWTKGSMMRPWSLDDNWAYNENASNRTRLTLGGEVLAEWDIVEETGVSGFGNFLGNLLIYASDQRNSGVAIYDATDIYHDPTSKEWKPRLLDVFNTPQSQGGVGGYWSEISGHYLVFAREQDSTNPNSFPGIQVVDFSDPSDLKLQCQAELLNPEQEKHWTLETTPMYVGFQDEYAFVDNFKVNIETCEVTLRLDISNGERGNQCNAGYSDCPKRVVSTSQYSRIVGNLWITGGNPTKEDIDGMAIWVHQSEPDMKRPYIAYHIPQANQTNYPTNAPLGFSIPETLQTSTIVTTETRKSGQRDTLTLKTTKGKKVRIDYVLSHQGILTVEPVKELKPNTTYEVKFSSGIKDAAGNQMQPYSFRFTTGDTLDGEGANLETSPALIERVESSSDGPLAKGQKLALEVVSENAQEFQIWLEEEAPVWQESNRRTFRFNNAGIYLVYARARNPNGKSALQRIELQVMENERPLVPGNHSSQLVCDSSGDRVWAVNPDNESISILNAETLSKRAEIYGLLKPQNVALVGSNEIWVTSRGDDQVFVFDKKLERVKRSFSTGYGSAPSHILVSPDGLYAYISLSGAGKVVRYTVADPSAAVKTIDLAPTVQAMALSPDGAVLLVARLISPEHWGEVFEIDTKKWTLQHTYRLEKHMVNDALDEGRGKPNYLTGILINGDGNRAYIVGKKDNIDRGLLNGLKLELDDDNTVRTIAITLDLDKKVELKNQRVDFDNTSSLSALAMNTDSSYLFVAQQGKNTVQALQIGPDYRFTGKTHNYGVGLAPQGLCFDHQRNKLFTKNFTDRTVTELDFKKGFTSPKKNTVSTVSNEKLSKNVLSGLKIFYNAFNGLNNSASRGKMSAEGYLSCASCHIDGGHDGNTYDMSARGEGFRNNISLKGRKGTRFGNIHWSANFDEVHDFENDIRINFKGTGFLTDAQFERSKDPLGPKKSGLSEDLDNLAAYVSSLGRDSLPRSPFRRSNGKLTSFGLAGRKVFNNYGCGKCHSGKAFTDGKVYDVGTIRPGSGGRRGGLLKEIKTPSLLGVFSTPPYLHDGSAESIGDVFKIAGGKTWQVDSDVDLKIVNGQAIQQQDYSYLRNAGGVRLIGEGATVSTVDDYSRGVGGVGKLRVRYGSSSTGGNLEVNVDDKLQGTIALEQLPLVEGVDALFTESSTMEIQLPSNPHRISFVYRGSGGVVIDEFTVSNSNDIKQANAHLVVAGISAKKRKNLISYLKQIGRASAPDDNEKDVLVYQGDEVQAVADKNSSVQER